MCIADGQNYRTRNLNNNVGPNSDSWRDKKCISTVMEKHSEERLLSCLKQSCEDDITVNIKQLIKYGP